MDDRALDRVFQDAVGAIDAGNLGALKSLLAAHPELGTARLTNPGSWLKDLIGGALNGFFARPFLLWFVAEDPVRTGKLPANIGDAAKAIIDAAAGSPDAKRQYRLDHTLRLVGWSWIARECGVQIRLIDTLIDAGASPDGVPNNALVNRNTDAARHLVRRGALLTLATALCLEEWEAVDRLLPGATPGARQFGFTLAALNGNAAALRRMISAGVDLDARCPDLYPHGTPLHHAVSSGSLAAVRVLVEAGADRQAVDTAWNGTPLGWAVHYLEEGTPGKYPEIAAFLGE